MEGSASQLLSCYERGTLTRRELIVGLTTLMAAGSTVSAAGPKGIAVSHLSLQVSDLQRSQDFYTKVIGASLSSEPRPDGSVRLDLGPNGYLVLRKFSPAGRVDHVGIKIEGFNKDSVARQLKGIGIAPIDEPNFSRTQDSSNGGAGFHVVDPDGFNVQLG
jgi:catechol 2,3-dioxygenase-like lactoylglutathione lyase family enzyme